MSENLEEAITLRRQDGCINTLWVKIVIYFRNILNARGANQQKKYRLKHITWSKCYDRNKKRRIPTLHLELSDVYVQGSECRLP